MLGLEILSSTTYDDASTRSETERGGSTHRVLGLEILSSTSWDEASTRSDSGAWRLSIECWEGVRRVRYRKQAHEPPGSTSFRLEASSVVESPHSGRRYDHRRLQGGMCAVNA